MPFRNLANFDDIDDIDQLRDYYYRTVSETIQTKCSFLKRIGGKWKSSCGFLEDEKSICTDTLEYQIRDILSLRLCSKYLRSSIIKKILSLQFVSLLQFFKINLLYSKYLL